MHETQKMDTAGMLRTKKKIFFSVHSKNLKTLHHAHAENSFARETNSLE